MGDKLRPLPLAALHEKAGARFGAFAGWRMPLTYSAGVMKEHLYTRDKAGLFDISHMQLFSIKGPDAPALLSRACPIDAAELCVGKSRYTFLLNEDAGIIDDLIVTRLSLERFLVVANAGNAGRDKAHLFALSSAFNVVIEPLQRVFLALQGPESENILTRLGLDLSALPFMSAVEPRENWFVARSGYTGEDGFEIALPHEEAQGFVWQILADARAQWIGLAARDSLRLEAGLCLHGQDIDETTDPVSAGLLWAIGKELRKKDTYVGAKALQRMIEKGVPSKRVGLKPEGRRPVRSGTLIMDRSGNEVGRVTSGGFGPCVDHPVAMGYVDQEHIAAGGRLFAQVRGTLIPLHLHPLPFMPHHYRKG